VPTNALVGQLRIWFMAMWFVTSQKNGVSAFGLQRVLGLGSYETAWTWLHKLRRAMVRPGRDRLSGTVEVDETYVGGAEKGKWGREVESKAIIAVAAEEDGKGVGRIRLRRIAAERIELLEEAAKCLDNAAAVIADEVERMAAAATRFAERRAPKSGRRAR
jgi:hypothetical protein